MAEKEDFSKLNLHQKILKIADMAGVLQKNKEGFGYKYVTEDEIQSKVTAGMQKYGVMLYTQVVPGTLNVQEINYTKFDKRTKADKNVHEMLVTGETLYTWVNTDNPTEKMEIPWVVVGQMDDASMAFGAGTTYCNRYMLMKTLQLAAVEDDVDEYRSRQRKADAYEEEAANAKQKEEVQAVKNAIKTAGSDYMKAGGAKEALYEIISKLNNGEPNPSTIKDVETANKVLEAITKAKSNLGATKSDNTKKKAGNAK